MKITIEHLRDYQLPQKRIMAERHLEKFQERVLNSIGSVDKDDKAAVEYWSGYLNAIRSLEDLVQEGK